MIIVVGSIETKMVFFPSLFDSILIGRTTAAATIQTFAGSCVQYTETCCIYVLRGVGGGIGERKKRRRNEKRGKPLDSIFFSSGNADDDDTTTSCWAIILLGDGKGNK